MRKTGFTIIELLIVITIIGILIGVAVPYYNDYIYDARLSVLKQNLATWRSAINQFRGDNLRGPFVTEVASGAVIFHAIATSTVDSELTAGPVQIIDGEIKRRANIKYLPRLPILQDPATGADIPVTSWKLDGATAYYHDANNNGRFDIGSEFAFIDGNNNKAYDTPDDATFDTGILFRPLPAPAPAYASPTCKPLDYTTITVTGSDGAIY